MKIIFMEDSSKSIFGGGQKISSFILSALNKNEFELIYVDFAENHILQSCLKGSNHRFIHLFDNKKRGIGSSIINMVYFLPNFLILAFNIFNSKADLIYTSTKRSLIYGSILGFIFNKPYVYHAHMLLQGKIYDPLILFLIKKAKKCICVSQFVLDEFKKKGLSNLHLLNNPIENEILSKEIKSKFNQINVAYIGSIIEIKGVNFLLDIFRYNFVSGVVVHIFGEGDQLKKMKEIYHRNPNIIFHGFVKNIISFLDQLIDVLILPSIIPEAAPTVIQMANSRGVPVITTNIGGQKTFIQDGYNGILVNPQNTFMLAKGIMKLKDNPKYYKRMSLNCLNFSKNFDNLLTFNSNLIKVINQIDESTTIR